MRFSVYQESKKGGRRINQDRMGYLYTRDSLLMLVADGMGGHARGEVASQLTLQTVASIYQRDAKPLLTDPVRFLEDSVLAAHRELHRYRAEHSLPEAPRTTLVACIVQQGVAIWAHVGDSRLYMIRAGRILERTIDHSRVHHLVQSGLIRAEDAKDHPERNRIFNCIGAYVAPTVEVSRPIALRNGDTLLLCSDGMWGTLNDRQVADAFAGKTVMRAVPELMELALERQVAALARERDAEPFTQQSADRRRAILGACGKAGVGADTGFLFEKRATCSSAHGGKQSHEENENPAATQPLG